MRTQTDQLRHARGGSARRRLLPAAALMAAAVTAAGALSAPATSTPPGTVAPTARAAVQLNHCVDDDNGVPQADSMLFHPTAVDVSAGPATVEVSVRISDDGGPGPANGVDSAEVEISSLADGPGPRFFERVRLHGSRTDIWNAWFTVPQHAPPGEYAITSLSASDGTNHLDRVPLAGVADPLFDTTFHVTSATPDVTPPSVEWLRLSSERVNTRKKFKKMRIQVKATDDLSGVRPVEVHITHQGQHEYLDLDGPGTGSVSDVYGDVVRVRKFVGNSTWRIRRLTVVDGVGNRRHYTGEDLRALGPHTFKVISRVDRKAPGIRSANLRPTPVNIRKRGRTLHFTAKLRDTRAGVASAVAIIPDRAIELERTAGNARKGTWRGKIRLDTCVDLPKWPRLRIETTDRVGNTRDEIIRKFRARSRDRVPPRISLVRSSGGRVPIEGPVRFRFSERVTGVDADSVSVRLGTWPDPGPELAGTWACFGKNGNGRSCRSAHVRFAEWTPDDQFEPGADYLFVFNPEGDLGIRDAAGNPPRRVELGAPTA